MQDKINKIPAFSLNLNLIPPMKSFVPVSACGYLYEYFLTQEDLYNLQVFIYIQSLFFTYIDHRFSTMY